MSLVFVGFLVCGLSVAIAEISARMWIRRQRPYVYRRWYRAAMAINEEALPAMERRVRLEVNSEGERGDPLPRDREGMYRIVAAGGSAVECGVLDQSSTWPAVLQHLLNRPPCLRSLGARIVHVGNIGRSLVPTEVIHEIVERTIQPGSKVDLLVLMLGASDVVRWLEKGTPADLEQERDVQEFTFGEDPNEEFMLLKGALALRRVVAMLVRRYGRVEHVRRDFGSRLVALRQRRQHAKEWLTTVPDPAVMLNKLEVHLRRLLTLSRGRFSRVIVVRQPWIDKALTEEEDAVMWNFCRKNPDGSMGEAYYAHAVVRELLSKMDGTVERVALELGIEQVNLRPSLDSNLTNYYDYLHFTPVGARRVAEIVSAAILRTQPVAENSSILQNDTRSGKSVRSLQHAEPETQRTYR
jgi:hypothetical protein